MVSDGADVIDVGGESTRPGAPSVPACEEMERVVPVIAAIREHLADAVAISVDTRSATVAAAAVQAGADIVNDVSAGLADASMLPTVARLRVPIVLMHMRGTPANMQSLAVYDDVVKDVASELSARAAAASEAGIPRWAVMLDPGIGQRKHSSTT